MTGSRRPDFASDDWMMEQQMRAQMEAEAWRRVRAELALAQLAAAEARPAPYSGGSAILKGLVRFGLGMFGAYLGWLAAVDSQLGAFEVWLATGAGFAIALSLSMLGPARQMVHVLSEIVRWCIIGAVTLGAVWLVVQLTG